MMTHDSCNCLIQNGGHADIDEVDDEEDGATAGHGNPGVHIEEIGEDDQPMNEGDEEDVADPQDDPVMDVPPSEDPLSDLDPDHNALEGIPSGHFHNIDRGEWINDDVDLYNPIPSFVNAKSDTLGPIELLSRELRKRKQGSETNADYDTSQKRKIESGNQIGFNVTEIGSGSGEAVNNEDKDRAAVGPVP